MFTIWYLLFNSINLVLRIFTWFSIYILHLSPIGFIWAKKLISPFLRFFGAPHSRLIRMPRLKNSCTEFQAVYRQVNTFSQNRFGGLLPAALPKLLQTRILLSHLKPLGLSTDAHTVRLLVNYLSVNQTKIYKLRSFRMGALPYNQLGDLVEKDSHVGFQISFLVTNSHRFFRPLLKTPIKITRHIYKAALTVDVKGIFNTLQTIWQIKFSPSNFVKYISFSGLPAYNILYLRKAKVFNKGRYSRNRQYYRTGVYWCLYVNIIAVVGIYFWFYRFTMNFGYLWWLLYAFIMSFIIPRTLKYRLYLPRVLAKSFYKDAMWLGVQCQLAVFNMRASVVKRTQGWVKYSVYSRLSTHGFLAYIHLWSVMCISIAMVNFSKTLIPQQEMYVYEYVILDYHTFEVTVLGYTISEFTICRLSQKVYTQAKEYVAKFS